MEKYNKQIKSFGIAIKPLLPELLVSFLQHPKSGLWESWLEDVYLSYNKDMKAIKKHISDNKESFGITISDIEEVEDFACGWIFTFYCPPLTDEELSDFYKETDWDEYADKWDNYTLPFQSFCAMKFLGYL